MTYKRKCMFAPLSGCLEQAKREAKAQDSGHFLTFGIRHGVDLLWQAQSRRLTKQNTFAKLTRFSFKTGSVDMAQRRTLLKPREGGGGGRALGSCLGVGVPLRV